MGDRCCCPELLPASPCGPSQRGALPDGSQLRRGCPGRERVVEAPDGQVLRDAQARPAGRLRGCPSATSSHAAKMAVGRSSDLAAARRPARRHTRSAGTERPRHSGRGLRPPTRCGSRPDVHRLGVEPGLGTDVGEATVPQTQQVLGPPGPRHASSSPQRSSLPRVCGWSGRRRSAGSRGAVRRSTWALERGRVTHDEGLGPAVLGLPDPRRRPRPRVVVTGVAPLGHS